MSNAAYYLLWLAGGLAAFPLIDSPRGAFTMSKAHNPVQDVYLREVEGRENKLVGVAQKGLADPARGCSM